MDFLLAQVIFNQISRRWIVQALDTCQDNIPNSTMLKTVIISFLECIFAFIVSKTAILSILEADCFHYVQTYVFLVLEVCYLYYSRIYTSFDIRNKLLSLYLKLFLSLLKSDYFHLLPFRVIQKVCSSWRGGRRGGVIKKWMKINRGRGLKPVCMFLCENKCLIFQTANRVLSNKLLGSC